MDDIIFQSNNQNSVYVLNSNCRAYEEFAHRNLINSNNATNVPKCQHSLTSRSGSSSCSACSQAFQNTLRNLGNFYDVTETIGNPVTRSPPLLSPAAATSTSAITPTATSCLPPAAAAFQKLFNCSYVANASGGRSVNAIHGDVCCEGGVDVNTALSTCRIKSNNNNKKKSGYVKPSLMAKKTKFRKFIEKEKWHTCGEGVTQNEQQQHCANNGRIGCSGFTIPDKFRANSCVKESNAAESTALTATTATCGPLNNIVKHYWNGKIDSNDAGSGKKQHEQQSKLNNWSGNGDTSNKQQDHFQMLKSSQQKQKSNYELYKEAAELLGLSCTLCDNCRCLECQSSYFDCDDSDSFSELSNSDEYDEETMNTLNNPVELVMYANSYSDDATTRQQKSRQQHTTARKRQDEQQQKANFMCADANCNLTELLRDGRENSKLSDSDDNEVIACTRQTDAIKKTEIRQKPKENSDELETFTSLNGLRLTDAECEAPLVVNDEREYKRVKLPTSR